MSRLMLPINELFQTIQGEGSFTGSPSTFVRLQGCKVGCPWCDTKHTWEHNPNAERTWATVMAKGDQPDDTYALIAVADLAGQIARYDARHVVITGGEPMEHEGIGELCAELLDRGKTVQIETSGTEPLRDIPLGVFVTVSPKVMMPGGKMILADALRRAQEVKMPVGKGRDIQALKQLLDMCDPNVKVYLQPLSQSKAATDLCMVEATLNGWRVSFQVHKYLGLR